MPDPSERAQHLVELGRHAEALDLLRTVLADSPGDQHALTLSAVAHLALEQNAEALAAADALVAQDPDLDAGHRLRSQALSGLRRRHEATRAAAEAVRLDPQDWAGHAQYALTAVHLPEYGADALAAARHAVALAPAEPDAHFALGYAAGRLARPEESEAAYRRALALDPTHTAARNNLTVAAGFSLGLGRQADGFAQVLREDPTERVALRNLERVAVAVLVRVYLGGLGVLVATTVAAAAGATAAVRVLVLVGGLALVVLGTVLMARRMPRGVLDLLRARTPRSPMLLALAVGTVVLLAVATWTAAVPYRHSVDTHVIQPLGLLNVLLLVWVTLWRRSDD